MSRLKNPPEIIYIGRTKKDENYLIPEKNPVEFISLMEIGKIFTYKLSSYYAKVRVKPPKPTPTPANILPEPDNQPKRQPDALPVNVEDEITIDAAGQTRPKHIRRIKTK